jgi:predicted enzyme related to lactoylglutathione lyase
MSTQTELVIGVDFLTLPSRDLEASARFYGDVLGLERSAVWQREGQPALGMEFETGTVTIALIDPTAIGQEFARHGFPVALRVPDVQAARERLEAEGVTFFGETMDTGVCHMTHFADPDGNVLMLHRRYAPKR